MVQVIGHLMKAMSTEIKRKKRLVVGADFKLHFCDQQLQREDPKRPGFVFLVAS